MSLVISARQKRRRENPLTRIGSYHFNHQLSHLCGCNRKSLMCEILSANGQHFLLWVSTPVQTSTILVAGDSISRQFNYFITNKESLCVCVCVIRTHEKLCLASWLNYGVNIQKLCVCSLSSTVLASPLLSFTKGSSPAISQLIHYLHIYNS